MKPFTFTCPKGHRFTVYADGMSQDERESTTLRGCPHCRPVFGGAWLRRIEEKS